MRITPLLLTISITIAVAGCGGGNANDATVGPCVVNYAVPLITVSSAVNASSIVPVSELTLANVSLNGSPADLQALTALSSNVQLTGNTLLCKVPCSFSTAEGNYAMSAVATGYQVAALSFAAKYATFSGGCPATYSGTKSIAVALQPL